MKRGPNMLENTELAKYNDDEDTGRQLLELIERHNQAMTQSKFYLARQIIMLFQQWLTKNEKGAIHFFKNHKESFLPFPSISSLIGAAIKEKSEGQFDETLAKKRVEDHFKFFIEGLKNQNNLKDILPLFIEYNPDIEKFSALLMCFLERGGSVEELLRTGLLQDFYRYHYYISGKINNPIQHLYKLLEKFEKTKSLAQRAGEVIFSFPPIGWRVLNGDLEKKDLEKLRNASSLRRFEFTVTRDNFAQLHKLFPNSFLSHAFKKYLAIKSAHHLNENAAPATLNELRDELVHHLNEKATPEELKNFIIATFQENYSKHLAILLNQEKIQQLIDANITAVLCLAPDRKEIIAQINEKHMNAHLDDIINSRIAILNGEPHLNKLHQLFALAEAFKGHQDLAEQICRVIINIVIDTGTLNKEVLEAFYKHASPYLETILPEKIEQINQDYSEYMTAQLDHDIFDGFHHIKSKWENVVLTLDFLMEICQRKKRIRTSENLPFKLNLDNFWEKIPEYYHDLCAIILDTTYLKQNFNFQKFEALLDMFLSSNERREESLAELLLSCIDISDILQIREWTIALLQGISIEHCLREEFIEITKILSKAANCGDLASIQFFLPLSYLQVVTPDINELLVSSSRQGHIKIAAYLCTLEDENKPSSNGIDAALYLAAQEEHMEIVHLFCALTSGNKPSQQGIDETLILIIEKGRLDIVNLLCTLPGNNKPSQQGVDLAFMRATIKGHTETVHYFCALTGDNRPSLKGGNGALALALELGHSTIISSLRTFISNSEPDQGEVYEALILAAIKGHRDIVSQLCGLTGNSRPSQQLIYEVQSLLSAGQATKLTTSFYGLCTRNHFDLETTQRMLETGLDMAAENGHQLVVRFLFSLADNIKPGQEAIEQALDKASKKGDTEFVALLQSLTGARSATYTPNF
jgi:hypothetical protein